MTAMGRFFATRSLGDRHEQQSIRATINIAPAPGKRSFSAISVLGFSAFSAVKGFPVGAR
jgi:hypothetical protein